ncbi:MAG: Holliday junction resolvase RuvX [Anaerolineae bacterium]|nr:Holliday junction resolvase RuvX [Anaerolineae bacterium]
MRLLALDIGERRIGIAVSESGLLAAPHGVLRRKTKKEDFARLQRLIEELNIERVIVGLPYSLEGPDRIGPQARRVKRYADALAKVVKVPLEYFDESYSTVDAETYLAELDPRHNRQKSPKRSKVPIDAAAAAVILQNYLDAGRQQHG